jgi:hypothetical protein
MDGEYSMQGREEKSIQFFSVKPKVRDYWEYLGVDWKIIL